MMLLVVYVGLIGVNTVDAQVKKNKSIKVSEKEVLKQKTLKWFKEIYVKTRFKDPYSYKLMNCVISPVTLKQKLDENERDLMYASIGKDTIEYYSDYQISKREVLKYKNNYEKALSKGDSSSILINKKIYDYELYKFNEFIQKINNIEKLNKEILEIKANASEKELNTIMEYKVYIDAYGKNSIGNLVLGKYYYTINKQGVTVSEVGTLD